MSVSVKERIIRATFKVGGPSTLVSPFCKTQSINHSLRTHWVWFYYLPLEQTDHHTRNVINIPLKSEQCNMNMFYLAHNNELSVQCMINASVRNNFAVSVFIKLLYGSQEQCCQAGSIPQIFLKIMIITYLFIF